MDVAMPRTPGRHSPQVMEYPCSRMRSSSPFSLRRLVMVFGVKRLNSRVGASDHFLRQCCKNCLARGGTMSRRPIAYPDIGSHSVGTVHLIYVQNLAIVEDRQVHGFPLSSPPASADAAPQPPADRAG